MSKKEKSTPRVKTVKEDLIYVQIKTIELLDEIINKNKKIKTLLDEDTEDQKIILQNLTKACESRNKAVHKIVHAGLINGKPDTQAKVIPFMNLDTILKKGN